MSNLKEIKEIKMTDLEKAEELKYYIDNDESLYNTLTSPLLKNYQKKLDKGEFDSDLAVKGFKHLTLAGAMELSLCNLRETYNLVVRKLTAQLIVSEFIIKNSLGNRFE